MAMPTNVVEGVEAIYGTVLPAGRDNLSGGIYCYQYHTVKYTTAVCGEDFLVDAVRRASEVAAERQYNAVLISEIQCTPVASGWDVLILLSIHVLGPDPDARGVDEDMPHPVLGPKGAQRKVFISDDMGL